MRVGTCKEERNRELPCFSTLIVGGVLLPERYASYLRMPGAQSRVRGWSECSRLGSFYSLCNAHYVWLIFSIFKKGSALDCLPIKGIMIFSDMSTGTNSPKVHPPNGTRFYTFQASYLHASGSSFAYSSLRCQLLLFLLILSTTFSLVLNASCLLFWKIAFGFFIYFFAKQWVWGVSSLHMEPLRLLHRSTLIFPQLCIAFALLCWILRDFAGNTLLNMRKLQFQVHTHLFIDV